jgi:hypothetical protein
VTEAKERRRFGTRLIDDVENREIREKLIVSNPARGLPV